MRANISAAETAGHFTATIRQGITMKRILLTTVSLGVLGLVSPVLGADLSSYSKAPVLASPVYDWSGFYVGAFGGVGFGNHNISDGLGNSSNFTNFTANYGSQGGFGGGEAGFNYQSGNYVLGIEADAFWSGIKGNDAAAILTRIIRVSMPISARISRAGLSITTSSNGDMRPRRQIRKRHRLAVLNGRRRRSPFRPIHSPNGPMAGAPAWA
jgi:hypothetical protein